MLSSSLITRVLIIGSATLRSSAFTTKVKNSSKFIHTRPSVNFQHTFGVNLSQRVKSSTTSIMSTSNIIPGRPAWQQSMLRISDADKSLKFYTEVMGMTLIDSFDFPQWKFSLYFVTTLPEGTEYTLKPGTQAAHDYLWKYDGVTLELTHNHEMPEDFKGYHVGNQEKDGFGHVAFSCDDVYAATDELVKAGVSFKKKPDEGRMKGLAFAYDPDGYWVELVKRGCEPGTIKNKYNLSQTMLRVKDPKKSIAFYESLGMKVVNERHFDDFSLYFLSTNPPSPPSNKDEAQKYTMSLFNPILELTHNHGTENDETFQHFNGNENGRQGFGHVGFLVDDVYQACDGLRPMGYGFRKEPDGGNMKGLAFAYDPDGYSVEIIKRGGIEFFDERKD